MVDDYKSRLQAAMRAKKVTAAELQAKLGITVQAVRKVLGEPCGLFLPF